MKTLSTLPGELLGVIGEHASLPDAKHLRLICRDFSTTFGPFVLNSLKIQLTTKNYERQLSMLQILASGKSCAAHVTKKLHIESLSPRLPPFRHNSGSELDTEEKMLAVEAEAKQYFGKALSSLRNVESLCWAQNSFSKGVEVWVYGEMLTFLKTCSTLRSFNFSTSTLAEEDVPISCDDVSPLPFEAMGHLNSIQLSGLGCRYGSPNFQHLSRHIALFKDLNRIVLVNHKLHEPQDFLNSLFLNYPDSKAPLRLTEVNLWSTIPVLTAPLLCHLRTLTHLTLRGRHGLALDPQHRSTDLDNFYIALKEGEIQLQKLDVTDAPPELFSYLQSYSGLKAFEIDMCDFFDETIGESKAAADAAGRRFFQVITGHGSSLECLRVSYKQKGEWAFNVDNAPIWSKMKRLRNARLVVVGTSYNGLELIVGDMPLLMDTFKSLPSMQVLEIDCEEGEELGYHPLDYVPEVYNGVRAFIRSFKFPITQAKPFSIKFSMTTFEPIPDAEGSWVYHGDILGKEFDLEVYSDEDEYGANEDWEEWDLEDELEHGLYHDFEDEEYGSDDDYEE